MVNKDKISNTISILTGGFALVNIQEVLSIIILTISIVNILFNAFIKIYNHYKEKNVKKVIDDINEAKEELEKLE